MSKLLLVFLLSISSAFAGDCDNLYYNHKPVIIANTIELCNSFYVVAYSVPMRGPIASFERFDASVPSVPRKDAFRADSRVPSRGRAQLSDYRNSGFDRGHLTPAGDASTPTEMFDTFLLSNMTPQSKKLNEIAWKSLEEHVRHTARGITYVATIAIYGPATIGENKLPIPAGYYKVIWYSTHTVEAFYANNSDDARVSQVSLQDVVSHTGITFSQ